MNKFSKKQTAVILGFSLVGGMIGATSGTLTGVLLTGAFRKGAK